MERLLISQLLKWKDSHGRKPLILEGARQVGKTWLLKEFGRKYFKDVCYINFEQSDVLEEIFAGDLSPQRIIEQLSIYNGKMIIPEETLIIFDEPTMSASPTSQFQPMLISNRLRYSYWM